MLEDKVLDVGIDEELLEPPVVVLTSGVELVSEVVLNCVLVEVGDKPLDVVPDVLFMLVVGSPGYTGGPRVLSAMDPFNVDVTTGYIVRVSVQDELASHETVQHLLLVLATLPPVGLAVSETVSMFCQHVLETDGLPAALVVMVLVGSVLFD